MARITPKSTLTTIWVIIAALIFVFTTGLAAFAIGAIIAAAIIYLVYAVGVRVHRRATGKSSPTKTAKQPTGGYEDDG